MEEKRALGKENRSMTGLDIVKRVDHALLFDDPEMFQEIGLTEDQIVSFIYTVSGPKT